MLPLDSPLPLLHDNITELLDVRDNALHHLPFEDAPLITFTLSFFSKAVVVLEVCLGSLSCWNTALWPRLWREGIMLCFSMSQYMLAFMVPSMNCSSPVPAALMQLPNDTPTTMLDCMQDTLVFVLLTWLPLHKLDTIWTKYVYLGLIRPQNMVPIIHVLSPLVFSKLFAGFLVRHL